MSSSETNQQPRSALEHFEDRTARQGGWTAWLWTTLVATGGAAFLYGSAWLLSIERAQAASNTPDGLAEVRIDDPGRRGPVCHFGDEPDVAEQEAEPLPEPMKDILPDRFAEFVAAEADRVFQPGGPIGIGDVGDSIGDRRRLPQPEWRLEYRPGSKEQYARILDFFRIKLATVENGAVRAAEGFARGAAPTLHRKAPADYYFLPQDAERRQADRELLAAAGVVAGDGAIFCQYFPDELTDRLRQLETAFAGRKPEAIAWTRFGIRPTGDGTFEFHVLDQEAK